jgi:hypothetical protein
MTFVGIGDQSSSLSSRPSTSGMRSVRKKSGDTRRTRLSVFVAARVPSIVSGSNPSSAKNSSDVLVAAQR